MMELKLDAQDGILNVYAKSEFLERLLSFFVVFTRLSGGAISTNTIGKLKLSVPPFKGRYWRADHLKVPIALSFWHIGPVDQPPVQIDTGLARLNLQAFMRPGLTDGIEASYPLQSHKLAAKRYQEIAEAGFKEIYKKSKEVGLLAKMNEDPFIKSSIDLVMQEAKMADPVKFVPGLAPAEETDPPEPARRPRGNVFNAVAADPPTWR